MRGMGHTVEDRLLNLRKLNFSPYKINFRIMFRSHYYSPRMLASSGACSNGGQQQPSLD